MCTEAYDGKSGWRVAGMDARAAPAKSQEGEALVEKLEYYN